MSTHAMPQVDDGELMMVNTLAVHSAQLESYLAELKEVLPRARQLESCLLLEAGQAADDPTVIVLTERWRSGIEYLNTVLALPFYQKYLEATESMYREARVVRVLKSL